MERYEVVSAVSSEVRAVTAGMMMVVIVSGGVVDGTEVGMTVGARVAGGAGVPGAWVTLIAPAAVSTSVS